MAEWILSAIIVLALVSLVLGGFIFQRCRSQKCGRLPVGEHDC